MGIVESEKKGFGLEGAGTITRVGACVEDVGVGDRVIALVPTCFSSQVRVNAQLCAKMPDELSFEDGATMPAVYGTVIYSLLHVGQLERNQVCDLLQAFRTLLIAVSDRLHPFSLWRSWHRGHSDLPDDGRACETFIFCQFFSC